MHGGELSSFAAVVTEAADDVGVDFVVAEVPTTPDAVSSCSPHQHRTATKDDSSQAMTTARVILERRGNSARQYRNMVVFLAPTCVAWCGRMCATVIPVPAP